MSLFDIFTVAGSAMSAQTIKMNLTAENLSHAEIPAGSAADVYKAKRPVFSEIQEQALGKFSKGLKGVQVKEIAESTEPVKQQYQPGHPLADENGFIYYPNVNPVEEMANMISASRSYQMNVEVLKTAKQLMMQTLRMGQ